MEEYRRISDSIPWERLPLPPPAPHPLALKKLALKIKML